MHNSIGIIYAYFAFFVPLLQKSLRDETEISQEALVVQQINEDSICGKHN